VPVDFPGEVDAMPRLRLGIVLAFLASVALGFAACQRQPAQQTAQPPADTSAADEAAIRTASREWSHAAVAKDLAKCVSYYADSARVFPPNAPLVTGPDAIRAAWAGMLAAPGPGLSFSTTSVVVAQSGDLGYETGVYTFTTLDERGQPNTTKGKYVAVWQKQADGAWKAVADIWNPDK
jgi:ketosteroid isomerase-like protein